MKKKAVTIFLIIILVFFVSGAIIINATNKTKINILLYGVDGRKDISDSERSDSIMLINYDFSKSKMIITSIPRDSYVQISCKNNQYDKINHSYAYGGQSCLNNTVSHLFGITNVYNIKLDFENIVNLIDYFGLIEITPQYTFCQIDEMYENKYCFEKGKKTLIDGKQALAYMRNRKTLPNGDFDRIKNQRQILKIILEKFMKLNLVNKIKFYNYVKKNIETDIEILDINIKKIISVQQIDLTEYTLKGEGYIDKYYYYKLNQLYLENIKKYYI